MEPQKTSQNQKSAGSPADSEAPVQPADQPTGPDEAPAQPADSQSDAPVPSSSFGDPLPESPQPAVPTDSQGGGFSPLTGAVVTSPLPVSSSRQKRGVLFGLIIAAILLLLSGGAAASYYYVVNKPDNVLKQALVNSFDVTKTKTAHFTGSLTAEQPGSSTTFELTYKGAVDNKTGALDVSGKADLLVTNLTFDLRSTDAKTFYAKLGGLGGLPELMAAAGPEASAYAPIISSLDDQWIAINESLLKQADKSYKAALLTEADMQKIGQAYEQYPVLAVKEVLASQKVGGQDSYHYKVGIDPVKLKSFLAALKGANLDSYKIDQNTLDKANEAIDKAKLENYPFDLWISKGDKLIKQVSFEYSAEQVKIGLRHTIDSYNQPVNVEKPKDAKSVMELMSGLLSSNPSLNTTLPALESESGISL